MAPVIKRFGWVRDLPDHRDRMFKPKIAHADLPERVNLREKFPVPCYNQGKLGSCTGNAIAGAIQFDRLQDGKPGFTPSRLFIYFNERLIEGTRLEDAGAMLRDGIKSIVRYGVCPEDQPDNKANWTYDETRFTEAPPSECYAFGRDHQAVEYERLTQSLLAFRACLAGGHPFVFGFAVCDSFMSKEVQRTGVADLPRPWERPIGGHAVLAVGYDDPSQRFIVRNSWGLEWGQDGYFTMPYRYLTHPGLSADFWTIRKLEA